MGAQWRDGVDVSSLLSLLEARRRQDSAGKVTYVNTHLDDEAFILMHAVKFASKLAAEDRQQIMRMALFTAVEHGSTLKEALITGLDRGVANHYKLPLRDLIVVTGISMQRGATLPR